MRYINNYREPIELGIGETEAALSLPDGQYRLTLTNADSTRWEIVDADVTDGIATLTRAREGTANQNWPGGSSIYCALTAGVLNDLLSRIEALEQGGGLPGGALVDDQGNALVDGGGNYLTGGA